MEIKNATRLVVDYSNDYKNQIIQTKVIKAVTRDDIFAVLSWSDIDKKVFVKYYERSSEIKDSQNPYIDFFYHKALKYCEKNGLTLWSY